METASVERRLAAIIAMDVVSYSRLMGADEVGTLTALKAHRAELINPAVATHHGRLVKTTGDGLLLEFASVVDAIGCAVAIQRGMLTRNAGIPEDKRIVFRVGVNIGDIIIDGSDIYGDGVNVAARLEALCEPGGVCISRSANEQIRDKLSLSFADLGDHMVKNIARAVGVFGLAAKDIATLPEIPVYRPQSGTASQERGRRRIVAIAAAAGAVFLVGGGAWWLAWREPTALPQDFERQLAAALAKSIPAASVKYREDTASAYAKLPPFRAIAVAPRAGASWRVGGWSSREEADEKAREKCQQAFDEPCAVVAVNDVVHPPGADGTWPVRDAPRVRYAGLYNPERIPGLNSKELQRRDVAAYGTAPSPKAAAFHAGGVLHIVSGAASQRTAEEQALHACNNDPVRKVSSIPCFLYAVENRVVLPLRSVAPLAAAAPAPASVSATAPARALSRAALVEAMAKVAPAQTASIREEQADAYQKSVAQKAMALWPSGASWRTSNWGSPAIAEERVLEACQVRYGGPCVLIAVNDALQPQPASGDWPRRPMPRVAYAGKFDPQHIPAINETVRQRQDVAGYAAKQGAKAAALHPQGRVFIVTDAVTQRAAEERALAECNTDPQRSIQAGPCLLYAAGDQVVLTRRSQSAIAP